MSCGFRGGWLAVELNRRRSRLEKAPISWRRLLGKRACLQGSWFRPVVQVPAGKFNLICPSETWEGHIMKEYMALLLIP